MKKTHPSSSKTNRQNFRQIPATVLALVLAGLTINSARAGSGSWNVDAAGNWSTSGNWNPAGAPGTAPGDIVSLTNNIGGARTVTIDAASPTLGTLNIGDSGSPFYAFTLAASGAYGLTFNNGSSTANLVQALTTSSDVISAPITLLSDLNINNCTNLTLSGVISGGKALTLMGVGALTFSGVNANTYTGATTISAGELILNKTSGITAVAGDINVNGGELFVSATNQIANTANITINSGFMTGTKPQTINNLTIHSVTGSDLGNLTVNGTLAIDTAVTSGTFDNRLANSSKTTTANALNLTNTLGTLSAQSGTSIVNVGSGGLTMSGATIQFGNTSNNLYTALLTLNGNFTGTGNNSLSNAPINTPTTVVDLGGLIRTFNITGGSSTIAPMITNGGLTVIGAGALNLTGPNTYTSATTVSNGGTLMVQGSLASSVTVTNGLLGGHGAINGAVTIQAGGTLQPGSGGADTSVLSISGALNLLTGSTTLLAINRPNAASGATNLGTVNFGGALTVNNVGSPLQAGDSFKLFSAGTYSQSFATMNLPALGEGLAWDTSNLGSGSIAVVHMTNASWNADVSDNWSASGRWSPVGVPGTAAGDIVSLTNNITAARTITIDTTSRTVGTLNIGDSGPTCYGFTLAGNNLAFDNKGSGANLVQALTTASDSISTPLTLSDNLTINNCANLTVSGVISGGAGMGLTKTGAGQLTLSAASANTYSGGTIVSGGLVTLSDASSNAIPGNLTINAGQVSWGVANDQIADSANVTVNSGGVISAGGSVSDTINSLTIHSTNGNNLGGLVILGALTIDTAVTTGTLDNRLANSTTTNSAYAVNLTNTLGTLSAQSGNSALIVGGGGLTMSGATIQFGNTSNATHAAQVTLNGDFFGYNNNSFSNAPVNTPTTVVDLGGAVRIFNIASGATTIAPTLQNGGLTLTGPGTLTLAGANTYTGDTTVVPGGTLYIQGNQPLATGSIFVGTNNAGASPSLVDITNGAVVAVGAANQVQVGMGSGGTGSSIQTLNVEGTVTDSGTFYVGRRGVVNISGTWIQNGDMSLNSVGGYGSLLTINGGTFTYAGSNPIGMNPSSANDGAATLTINGGTFTTRQGFLNNTAASTGSGAMIVLTNGGTLALSAGIAQLTSGTPTNTSLSIGNLSSGGGIDTGGYSTTVSNSINGSGCLTKLGLGMLTLAGANTYAGNTIVNTGTLQVQGNGSLASGVTVCSTATLNGNGTIAGSVTNQSGGTLAPGLGGTESLSIGGSLILSNGSATVIVINRGNASNASGVTNLASVAYGGALTVTNVGADLQAGDTFKLFSAASRSGAFSLTNLPAPLNSGLAWDATRLSIDGTIKVMATTGPTIILNGANPAIVAPYSSYTDAGAWGTNYGTHTSVTVGAPVFNNVNTSLLGSYSVTYTAQDNGYYTTNTRAVLVTFTNAGSRLAVYDPFEDGSRTNTGGNPFDPLGLVYWMGATGSTLTVTNDSQGIGSGQALLFTPSSTYQKYVAAFSPLTLANAGDSVTLRFNYRFPNGPVNFNQGFRVGLYNSMGYPQSGGNGIDGNPNNIRTNWVGYGFYTNPGTNTPSINTGVYSEAAGDDILGGTAGITGQGTTGDAFDCSTNSHSAVFQIALQPSGLLALTAQIDGGQAAYATNLAAQTKTFDEFAIGEPGVNYPFLIDNLTINTNVDGDFGMLRTNWWTLQTGGTNYNIGNSQVKAWFGSITNAATNYIVGTGSQSMTYGSTIMLFNDGVPNTNSSGHITTAYNRIQQMALAYFTIGCSLYTNASLRSNILYGLKWMNTNRYSTTLPAVEYDDWWDWEIGAPLKIVDIGVFMYNDLGMSGLSNCLNAVDRFVPAPGSGQPNSWTGCNLTDKIRVMAVRGAVVKDASKLFLAQTAFSSLFPYVTTADGFYKDGSYVQHTYHAYTGAYGVGTLEDISYILPWLFASPWQVTDPAQTNVMAWVTNSYRPLLYNGEMMDMTRGRSVSYSGTEDVDEGKWIMCDLLRLGVSGFLCPVDATNLQGMVKYLANNDSTLNFTNGAHLNLFTAANWLMTNSVTPPPEPVGHWTYAGMDQAVHLRPGWGLGLAMNSTRMSTFESILNENLHGWHQLNGMTYFYASNDITQFSGDFWPTVDPYKLPGTTSDSMALPNSFRENCFTSSNWVGGVTLGTNGAAGMDFRFTTNNLAAKKSWFMFDNEVVCLGAGINDTNTCNVWTTALNRKISILNTNKLYLAPSTGIGSSMPLTLNWSTNMTNMAWCELDGFGGIYFPGNNTNVHFLREQRTNSWYNIATDQSAANCTNNYLTVWFDHLVKPVNATYAYVALPNASATLTSNYWKAPSAVILTNTTSAQAVKETSLGIVAVNNWTNGWTTNDIVAVNNRASVMVQTNSNGDLYVALSDPTQTNAGTIRVTVNYPGIQSYWNNPLITVVQKSPVVILDASVGNTFGASLVIKLCASLSPRLVTKPLGSAPPNMSQAMLVDGQIAFQIAGNGGLNSLDGSSYTIEASTNLVDWQPIHISSRSQLPATWLDTNTANFDKRFYRVLIGP